MLVACLTVALNVGLNLTLSRVMGVNGLALATTISCMVGAVVLAVMLRKRLGHIGFRKTALELGKVMGAGALCLAAALVLNGKSGPRRWARAGCCCAWRASAAPACSSMWAHW